jgi:hypothetical protein
LGLVLLAESFIVSLRPNLILERVENSTCVRVVIRIFRVSPQQKSCYRGRHKSTFWLLLRDRLSTRNILKRKNRVLDDYNCPMCNSSVEETSEHLFLSCPFATWCWRFIYVSWDMSVNIFDRIVEGRRSFGKKFFRELLLIACWAI